MTFRVPVTVGLLAVVWLATPASATHLEPRKAKRFRADLVTAYEPCTAPNAFGDESGRPACLPPVRSDPVCGFGPKGSGRVKIAVSGTRVVVSLRVRGLDEGCEDAFLSVSVTAQVTADDCGGSPCTMEPISAGFTGCQVTEGRCSFTARTPPIFIVSEGARSGFEIGAVDVGRENTRPFRMGILVP